MIVSLFLVAVPSLSDESRDCRYLDTRGVEAGRDAQGYYVRTLHVEGVGNKLGRTASYQEVGDYLASEAGAIIFYFGTMTQRDAGPAEWRAADPLTVLKAFAVAAGLEVETPAKDFWMIGGPWVKEEGAVTLFAQPLDPRGQAHLPSREAEEIERALVSQLPIRHDVLGSTMRYAGVSYYWLPKEGRNILLVLGTSGSERRPTSTFHSSLEVAFKVRVNRVGGKLRVTCLWQSEAPAGRLLPEIDEDFDGDGYRDFVFNNSGDRDWEPSNVVLSGKEGTTLFAFYGTELAVEKGVAGPKRIGVPQFYSQEETDAILRVPLVDRNLAPPRSPGPHVLKYSREDGEFEREEPKTRKASAAAAGERPTERPERALAEVAGGPGKVRLYLIGQINWNPHSPFEQVLSLPSEWTTHVTPELIKQGYPARILNEYKSPGYLAAEEKRAAAARVR